MPAPPPGADEQARVQLPPRHHLRHATYIFFLQLYLILTTIHIPYTTVYTHAHVPEMPSHTSYAHLPHQIPVTPDSRHLTHQRVPYPAHHAPAPLQTYHARLQHVRTHTVRACIPSPASSLHTHLAQAFTRATPHASSRSRHLHITSPFQGGRLRPPPYQNSKPTSWIKECEGDPGSKR